MAPGELGIRHEDTVVVTENGCENFVPEVVGDARGAGGVATIAAAGLWT